MRLIARVLIAGVCAFSAGGVWPFNMNEPAFKEVSQAYGFLLGQELSLAAIEKRYPDLKPRAELAKLQFQASFPDAKDRLEAALLRRIIPDQRAGYPQYIAEMLQKQIGTFTRESAEQFLQLVTERARGQIDSPVKERILSAEFDGRGDAEMRTGYTQDYTGQAKDLEFRIRFPLSWKGSPGNLPNIARMWVSENGTGLGIADIVIREMPVDSLSQADLQARLADNFKEFLPDGVTASNARIVRLDGVPAFSYEMDYIHQGPLGPSKLRGIAYGVIYRSRFFNFNCMAAAVDRNVVPVKEYEDIRHTCGLIANSISFPQRYR